MYKYKLQDIIDKKVTIDSSKAELYILIVNNTVPNEEIVNFLYEKALFVYSYGKYADAWDYVFEKEWRDEKGSDKYDLNVSICNTLDGLLLEIGDIPLDSFIYIYDDENLMNYISNMFKDDEIRKILFKKILHGKQRIELNLHTNSSLNTTFINPEITTIVLGSCDGFAITDTESVNAFYENEKAKEYSSNKRLYGAEIEINGILTNVICRNGIAKKELFKIIYKDNPIIKNREYFYLGSLLFDNGIFDSALSHNLKELKKQIQKYDFIEVAPISTYRIKYKELDDKTIKQTIRTIIETTISLNKLPVASSTPYYLNRSDMFLFNELYNYNHKDNPINSDIKLDTYGTEELKYEFNWLNDEQLIEDIVVNNTHTIADNCRNIKIASNKLFPPLIHDSYRLLVKKVNKRLNELYGDNINTLISERLNEELRIIKDKNYSSMFCFTSELVEKIKQKGYTNGYRGAAGNSLVTYLLGITDSNPLPPHYLCPKCHKLIFEKKYKDGFDMPRKKCGCGCEMINDGHDLKYEFLLGNDGEQIPLIDINVSDEIDQLEILKEIAGKNDIYSPYVEDYMSRIDAQEIVDNFAGKDEGLVDYCTKEYYINDLCEVKTNEHFIDGGYYIVPKNMDIYDLSPVVNIDGKLGLPNSFVFQKHNLYKQNIIQNYNQKVLGFIIKNNINNIDINDQKIYDLINGKLEYGLQQIPEFSSEFSQKIINIIKPKKFSDLVKANLLTHGTNVWNNNGETLIKKGKEFNELIASGDDVFDYLVEHNIPKNDAYKLARKARLSKTLNEEDEVIMLSHNIPKWYIESINKIYYMYPKGHAIQQVKNALIIAWLKIYKPALFYIQWIEFRAECVDLTSMFKTKEEIKRMIDKLVVKDELDKDRLEFLNVILEMKERGINIIDKHTADSNVKLRVNPNNENEILFE